MPICALLEFETDLLQVSLAQKKMSATILKENSALSYLAAYPTPHEPGGGHTQIVSLGKFFSWFPLGNQLQNAPLGCAQPVRREPKKQPGNENPGRQDPQANSTQHLWGNVSMFVSWVGALADSSVVENAT